MKIVTIPIKQIDATGRSRPVSPAVAAQLAEDIAQRGLRQPIEVAETDAGWRLVSGGHRLEAHNILGVEKIDAVAVAGNTLELRRDELMENLARSELTALERAVSLADLKGIYQELNPGARHGGDRTKEQDATLASWYLHVAHRSERSERTIKRYAAIGQGLSPKSVERLRRTEFEDNQRDLELLSRQDHDRQAKILALLFGPKDPAKSVGDAIERLDGHTGTAGEADKKLNGLVDRWGRAPKDTRRAFIMAAEEEHLDELAEFMADRGYVLTRTTEAAA